MVLRDPGEIISMLTFFRSRPPLASAPEDPVLRFDFDDSPGWWVVSTARALERTMAAELRPLGITYRQCQVLASLAQHGPLSQADLARELGIEPPTLTGVLSRMERDGWVARRACPTDARKNLVHPQEQAQEVWDRIVATALPLRARATEGISKEELRTLRTLLARIRDNVADVAQPETAR
jgi:MarR family transcriptional regulator for hemolysin